MLSSIEKRIKEKIEKVGTPLKDWNIQINYGIKTGFNDAFIIDGIKRKELIDKHPKSEEIIRPILRGRDIKRYGYEFADLWLLYVPWHFPLHNDSNITGASEVAEKEFEIEYPAIYNHLHNFKKNLSNRNKAETGIRYEWYALQRLGANYWSDLSKEKIIWKRVGSLIRFGYDNIGYAALDSTCFATGNHIKYLVAILNSKIGSYMLQDSPKTGTGDLLVSVQAVEPILIPEISEDEENHFNHLIDKIITSQSKGESTQTIEAEIDKLVYSLYCLNTDEVDFIEN